MPARLQKVVRWLRRRGITVDEPRSGSHWKVRLPDGSAYPIPAPNALKSEIKDCYLKALAEKCGVSFEDMLAEL